MLKSKGDIYVTFQAEAETTFTAWMIGPHPTARLLWPPSSSPG